MNVVSAIGAVRHAFGLPKYAALIVRLLRDARVSALLKIGAAAAALLVISPLDVFGDIPVLGALDDVALLLLVANLFVRLCPDALVAEHRRAVGLDASEQPAPTLKDVTPR